MTLDKAALKRGRTERIGGPESPLRSRRQQRQYDRLLRRQTYKWYGAPREVP